MDDWQPIEDADYPPNTNIRVKYADGAEGVGYVLVTDMPAEWVPDDGGDRPWPIYWRSLPPERKG